MAEPIEGAPRRRSRQSNGEILTITPDGDIETPPGAAGPGAAADFVEGDTDATRKTADLYWEMLGTKDTGTGYVTVTHHPEGYGNKGISCGNYPSDKYTLAELIEVVRREHAARLHPGKPGDYRFMLWAKTARGNNAPIGNKLETILAPAVDALPVAPGAIGNDAVVMALMREMREMRAEITRSREVAAPSVDWKGALIAAQPFLLPFVAALAERMMNPPKRDGLGDLKEILALTGTIKELRADNEPAPADDAPWYAAPLMGLMQNLPGMLAAGAMRLPTPKSPPAPAADAGGQPAPAPMTYENGGNGHHPFYQQLAAVVSVAGEADPDEVAGMLWEQVPEGYRPQVLEFLTGPGYFRRLAEVHPGVMDHPGFFADLTDALLEISTAPVQTEPTNVGTGVASNGAGQDHGTADSERS